MAEKLKKEWGFLHPCHAAGGAFYYLASDVDAEIDRLKAKLAITDGETDRLSDIANNNAEKCEDAKAELSQMRSLTGRVEKLEKLLTARVVCEGGEMRYSEKKE